MKSIRRSPGSKVKAPPRSEGLYGGDRNISVSDSAGLTVEFHQQHRGPLPLSSPSHTDLVIKPTPTPTLARQ